MYLRFTLSYRDIEDLLAERGIEVSYETIRRWVSAFGPRIARRLRAQRPAPHRRWHLDEMFVRIGGSRCTSGVPLMSRVRCSRCWFRPGGTRPPPAS
jgi:transposase-like protein